MAQWFRKIFNKLFMKKPSRIPLLEYNTADLAARLALLQNKLYEDFDEKTVKIIVEALTVALNVQVLAMGNNVTVDPLKIGNHHGRIQAFGDFIDWLRRSLDKDDYTRRTKGNQPSGTKNISDIRQYRRSSNQAGPAIS